MKEKINFGVGFITGRPNVCNIINSYYKFIIKQVEELKSEVSFTFFILYDLEYLNTPKEEFYKILPEVHENIKIKYLTPESVIERRQELINLYGLSEEKARLLVGKGYARARNTILYEAVKEKVDYLLFWDDDEYPLASVRDGNVIKWIKQKNVLQHIKNIENADITFGYRCGMINPLPYVKYNDILTENVYKEFIEAIENEVISWDKVQCMYKAYSGIGFAEAKIADYSQEPIEVKNIGKDEFLLGSGICLNLRHLDKIPAFYNPPGARGEDTFFSCALSELDVKVLRIPVYHFHDAFLRFQFLMEEKYPKRLKKIISEDNGIELRFIRSTTGWVKYKPLLCYIENRSNYREIMDETKQKLIRTSSKVSTAFQDCDLTNLSSILEEYDKNVEIHYQEYLKVNDIWNSIKYKIGEGIKV